MLLKELSHETTYRWARHENTRQNNIQVRPTGGHETKQHTAQQDDMRQNNESVSCEMLHKEQLFHMGKLASTYEKHLTDLLFFFFYMYCLLHLFFFSLYTCTAYSTFYIYFFFRLSWRVSWMTPSSFVAQASFILSDCLSLSLYIYDLCWRTTKSQGHEVCR